MGGLAREPRFRREQGKEEKEEKGIRPLSAEIPVKNA